MFFCSCLAANEIIFGKLDKTLHCTFERTVDRAQFGKPGGKVFFKPHGKQGPHSEVPDGERLAGLLQRQIEFAFIGRLYPDFVTKIAGVGNAVDPAGHTGNCDFPVVH